MDLSKGNFWDFGKQFRPWLDATERGVIAYLQCRIFFLVVYATDRSKAVVPVLVLLFVALWFILRGDFFYVLPCVILFLCCCFFFFFLVF